MRKNSLPDRERQICKRLRQLRVRLGLSEEAIAAKVGITRGRWHNYEMLRSPLRCDVALRVCRQLIVSEEWLATGNFKLSEEAAREKGIQANGALAEIFFHNLVDLQAEPEFLQTTPGQLFSSAFDEFLSPKYATLVKQYFHFPRLVFRDSDGDELLVGYANVLNERWLKLIRNEALRIGGNPGLARRSFLRAQIDVGAVLFKRFLGFQTPEIRETKYDFLRAIANDVYAPIGPLHPAPVASEPSRVRPRRRHSDVVK